MPGRPAHARLQQGTKTTFEHTEVCTTRSALNIVFGPLRRAILQGAKAALPEKLLPGSLSLVSA